MKAIGYFVVGMILTLVFAAVGAFWLMQIWNTHVTKLGAPETHFVTMWGLYVAALMIKAGFDTTKLSEIDFGDVIETALENETNRLIMFFLAGATSYFIGCFY